MKSSSRKGHLLFEISIRMNLGYCGVPIKLVPMGSSLSSRMIQQSSTYNFRLSLEIVSSQHKPHQISCNHGVDHRQRIGIELCFLPEHSQSLRYFSRCIIRNVCPFVENVTDAGCPLASTAWNCAVLIWSEEMHRSMTGNFMSSVASNPSSRLARALTMNDSPFAKWGSFHVILRFIPSHTPSPDIISTDSPSICSGTTTPTENSLKSDWFVSLDRIWTAMRMNFFVLVTFLSSS